MIQRVQSIYLSLIFLSSLVLISGGFLNFADKSESLIKITFTGTIRDSGLQVPEILERTWPLTILILLIPIISVIAIFLFKNRKIQLRFSLALIFIIAGLINLTFYYGYTVATNYDAEIVPGMKIILFPVMLICAVLAYRGIKKDDNLVKSYDRLR